MLFYTSYAQGRACTMNCCLPAGDPRTKEDMVRDCIDCISVPKRAAAYRLVAPGDVLAAEDEALQADAVTWLTVAGHAVGPSLSASDPTPHRRPVRE